VTLGHEFAGEIVDVGDGVKDWSVGDRVVGEPHTKACGVCHLCSTGNPQICDEKRSPGWGMDGAFAPFMRFTEPKLLHRIPPGLDSRTACLTEPLANIVTDVVLTNALQAGDKVLVCGPGPIGIMAGLVAKHLGADQVIMAGTDLDETARLPFCREQDAIDYVINVQREEPMEILNDLTHGMGVDLVVEASGAAPAISLGAAALRKMGVFTAIGLTGRETIAFPYDLFMKKVIRFHFNMSTRYAAWEPSLSLLAKGVIPVDSYITHEGGIAQWESLFKALEEGQAIKAVFNLQETV